MSKNEDIVSKWEALVSGFRREHKVGHRMYLYMSEDINGLLKWFLTSTRNKQISSTIPRRYNYNINSGITGHITIHIVGSSKVEPTYSSKLLDSFKIPGLERKNKYFEDLKMGLTEMISHINGKPYSDEELDLFFYKGAYLGAKSLIDKNSPCYFVVFTHWALTNSRG